jgi:hypothetical protein
MVQRNMCWIFQLMLYRAVRFVLFYTIYSYSAFWSFNNSQYSKLSLSPLLHWRYQLGFPSKSFMHIISIIMLALPHCQVADKQDELMRGIKQFLGLPHAPTCDCFCGNVLPFNTTHSYIRLQRNKCMSLHVITCWTPIANGGVLMRGGVLGVEAPPKIQRFVKAEPNSQFCGNYIHNKLFMIWDSLILKLSRPTE